MTLSEFLLARIAEDEKRAPRLQAIAREADAAAHWALMDEARHLLAECEAKRRIVEAAKAAFTSGGLDHAVRQLAIVYASHPDYRDEWRP